MDSTARNCPNNLKNINPYAINVSQRKIHALGERSFFSVALRGPILSRGICFFGIYQKMRVIKYGSFHASSRNATIIAGKNGMIFNFQCSPPLRINVQCKVYWIPDHNNPIMLLIRMKSIKTFMMVRRENGIMCKERMIGIRMPIPIAR